jgi:hypothetical protein
MIRNGQSPVHPIAALPAIRIVRAADLRREPDGRRHRRSKGAAGPVASVVLAVSVEDDGAGLGGGPVTSLDATRWRSSAQGLARCRQDIMSSAKLSDSVDCS